MARIFALHLHADPSISDLGAMELTGAQDADSFHALQAVQENVEKVLHPAKRILALE
jgi:hypothetical protein